MQNAMALQSAYVCRCIPAANSKVAPNSTKHSVTVSAHHIVMWRSAPVQALGSRRETRRAVQKLLTKAVAAESNLAQRETRTCRNCKKQFAVADNHPRACRYHTAHYGGETKRKFEGVYTGGTMNTRGGGEVTAYWHCCGNEDAFDIGCEAAPHASYDD